MSEDTGSLVVAEDAGKGASGVAARWMMEIELAQKLENDWRKRADEASDRFRGERKSESILEPDDFAPQYNIFYSMIQTITPALYNQTPKPDVRRRYRSEDPMGKQISEVTERALSYTMDVSDIDRHMTLAVLDQQIVGRGVLRIKYEPTFGTDQDESGQSFEVKKTEEIEYEHVNWADFLHGPGRTWEEVEWVAFKHIVRREEAIELFGPIAQKLKLDYSPEETGKEDGEGISDTFKRLVVWEVWCEEMHEVLFIAPSHKDGPLKTEKDPLGLTDFFPTPRPLYATTTPDSLIPVEPYRYYRDQALELDDITARISGVIDACKVRGVYSSVLTELETLMDAGENMMIPSENIIELVSQGGIDKGIWMWPIEKIVGVLQYLYQQRDVIKSTIYEITGIADIMRGSSNANETLGAQQLKAQFGTMRLDDQKREVQRYARDIVRMSAEIMSEHFSIETLSAMTDMQITPEMMQIMQIDGPRGFRIDVETNSTVAGDQAADQKSMTELLGAISGFLTTVGPAVVQGYMPLDAAKAILLAAVRRFKLGREVEDAIDQIGGKSDGQNQQQQPGQPQDPSQQGQQGQQPDPQQQQADALAQQQAQDQQQKQAQDQQALADKARLEEQKLQADIQLAQAKLDGEMRLKEAELQASIQLNREKVAAELDIMREAAMAKAETGAHKTGMEAGMKAGMQQQQAQNMPNMPQMPNDMPNS